MTADEILKKYEDANEYHFHEVDRKWIIEAMKEYSKSVLWQQLLGDMECILNNPREKENPIKKNEQ
jgi:hypothetical protein